MAQKKLSYQQAFDELQTICDRIKNELIPIENLPSEIKHAKALVSYCENLLRNIDSEVKESEKT